MKRSNLIPVLLVCFTPSAAFLFIGSLFVPFQIHAIVGASEGALHWEGPLGFIAMITGGIVGLIALVLLAIRLLKGGEIDRPYLIIAGAIIGISSALPAALVAGPVSIIALGLLPLAGTAYILAAGRHLLAPLIKPSVRPVVPLYVCALALLPAIAVGALMHLRGNLSHNELLERRNSWLQKKPASYAYDVNTSGRIIDPPRRITVDGDRVVSAEDLRSHSMVNADARPVPTVTASWTMTKIFDELIEAQAGGADVRALFNDRLGFVEQASVEVAGGRDDWDLTVLNFRAP